MNHDEIRAALAAATPGPWAWLYPDQCCRDGYCIKSKADLDTCDGVTHAMKALHADVVLIANAPTYIADLLAEVDRLTSRALPDPKGGCVCESYSEDRGGGYFELMVEYEPACPEHSEHVYNPRTGVWEHDATAHAEAAEQAVQRVREFAEQGREFADRTMDDTAAHWARSAADGIIRALDGGE